MKNRYHIYRDWRGNYEEDIHFEGTIEIDGSVIDSVDDGWRKTFYASIKTPQDIANHIAYNMIVNDLTLSQMDGFANFSDDMVVLL